MNLKKINEFFYLNFIFIFSIAVVNYLCGLPLFSNNRALVSTDIGDGQCTPLSLRVVGATPYNTIPSCCKNAFSKTLFMFQDSEKKT